MSVQYRLQAAMDDLMRADLQVSSCHRTWAIARSNQDFDPAGFTAAAFALAEAAHMQIVCEERFKQAEIESQAAQLLEWERLGTLHGQGGARRGHLASPVDGGSPASPEVAVPEHPLGAAHQLNAVAGPESPKKC